MFASPADTLVGLKTAGYFTDLKVATAVFLAGTIHRPILLEGPAGAGKTELASSTARTLRVPDQTRSASQVIRRRVKSSKQGCPRDRRRHDHCLDK
jgi:MoxR-like ATPase